MKSLLTLLLLGIALAIGFWKTQYPETTFEDLTNSATTKFDGLKRSAISLSSGGASQEAIFGRLDSLEAELVENQRAADPSVIDSRLNAAENRMDASEAQLGELGQSISDQGTAISAMTTGPGAIAAKVSAIDSQLDLLNRRIDEQTQQFNADSINSGLSDLKTTVSQLQDKQLRTEEDQNASLVGINEKISSVEARLNTLSSDAANADAIDGINAQIDQRLAVLEDKIGSRNADNLRIESMTNEMSASRVKMDALESNVNETGQQLVELNRTIGNLKTQSESTAIDGQQSKLRVQLANLQNQMTRVGKNADITELTNSLQATRARIKTLEQRIIDLPASSSQATDATQAQSDLEAQIRALEIKLANVEASPDSNLANSISQVEEQVSALAAKEYVTQEELREQQEAKSTEYRIFFERNSTAITDDAGKVLDTFISQEQNRTTGVAIYGFTDRRGSAVYNQQLALQRATNVRSYLIQNGFDYTKIKSLSGLGEDAAAAELEDGQEDAQQRAVVLYAQQP